MNKKNLLLQFVIIFIGLLIGCSGKLSSSEIALNKPDEKKNSTKIMTVKETKWYPKVQVNSKNDFTLGMDKNKVREYLGKPSRSSTQAHIFPGGTNLWFDLCEEYYINGQGMTINGQEYAGSISFYYDRENYVKAIQLSGWLTSSSDSETPSFNGLQYNTMFNAILERFGVDTRVYENNSEQAYAHYYFTENENGSLELIPPSLNELQIKETKHAAEVYSDTDLEKYKNKTIYKLCLTIDYNDDGAGVITSIFFTR